MSVLSKIKKAVAARPVERSVFAGIGFIGQQGNCVYLKSAASPSGDEIVFSYRRMAYSKLAKSPAAERLRSIENQIAAVREQNEADREKLDAIQHDREWAIARCEPDLSDAVARIDGDIAATQAKLRPADVLEPALAKARAAYEAAASQIADEVATAAVDDVARRRQACLDTIADAIESNPEAKAALAELYGLREVINWMPPAMPYGHYVADLRGAALTGRKMGTEK